MWRSDQGCDAVTARLGVVGLILTMLVSLLAMGVLAALKTEVPSALSTVAGTAAGALAAFFVRPNVPSNDRGKDLHGGS